MVLFNMTDFVMLIHLQQLLINTTEVKVSHTFFVAFTEVKVIRMPVIFLLSTFIFIPFICKISLKEVRMPGEHN